MNKNIFYSEQLKDYVVDELCKCGHLKSEHGSKTLNISKQMLRQPNGGSCCGGSCSCKKFVFVRFVTVKEAVDITMSKRQLSVA